MDVGGISCIYKKRISNHPGTCTFSVLFSCLPKSPSFLCKRPSWQELHIPVVWACLQPFCIFLDTSWATFFVFKTYENLHSLVYMFWRVNQQPPPNKQHNFTTLHLLKCFFVVGCPGRLLTGRPVNWAFSKSSIEKFETAHWAGCRALENGYQ